VVLGGRSGPVLAFSLSDSQPTRNGTQIGDAARSCIVKSARNPLTSGRKRALILSALARGHKKAVLRIRVRHQFRQGVICSSSGEASDHGNSPPRRDIFIPHAK
jgi:hypothetical protein